MGAGEIDPGKVDKAGSAFNPGLVYDAGLFEYAASTCGADLGIFAPGSCAFLDGIGIPSDASDLNMASIGVAELAGSQTVTRTVTSVADKPVKYRANVKAPDGFDVVVSPSRFTIAPGDTQVIEITITSTGAAPGEWRFGSMELKGKGYVVTSPIAVNGALFDAPDEVAGTGNAGTAELRRAVRVRPAATPPPRTASSRRRSGPARSARIRTRRTRAVTTPQAPPVVSTRSRSW